MDRKYIGRTIALPKEAAALLLEVQESLISKLGFKPSLSDTVAYLCKQWSESNATTTEEVK